MSAHVFHVGEIAEVIDLLGEWPQYHGTECTITGPLGVYDGINAKGVPMRQTGYRVELYDGVQATVPAPCLRKRKPPRSDWGALRGIWQPKAREGA